MNQQEIQSKILDLFAEQRSRSGHVLPSSILEKKLLRKLNPEEIKLVPPAIDSLCDSGFIKRMVSNPLGDVALTESGYEYIYPNHPESTGDIIKKHILKKMSDSFLDVGEILFLKPVYDELETFLNPRQMEMFNTAVSELISKNFVTHDKIDTMDVLRLTETGYIEIYKTQ